MRDNYYSYQPSQGHPFAHDPFNAIIAPRPIGWISTVDQNGVANLAPYSFFNAFNYTPPIIGFSSIGHKDSVANIEQTGEFCFSLVSRQHAEVMNLSCQAVAPEIDEFELVGVSKQPGSQVAVPYVAESLVAMECKKTQIVRLEGANGEPCNTWVTFGEVVAVHIHQNLIENGVFNTLKADPLLRAGGPGDYFTLSEAQKMVMFRPT